MTEELSDESIVESYVIIYKFHIFWTVHLRMGHAAGSGVG